MTLSTSAGRITRYALQQWTNTVVTHSTTSRTRPISRAAFAGLHTFSCRKDLYFALCMVSSLSSRPITDIAFLVAHRTGAQSYANAQQLSPAGLRVVRHHRICGECFCMLSTRRLGQALCRAQRIKPIHVKGVVQMLLL
eukprot:1134152-Amphidinium_carterae.1